MMNESLFYFYFRFCIALKIIKKKSSFFSNLRFGCKIVDLENKSILMKCITKKY